MSFGSGYTVTEYNKFVPEGDYVIRLGNSKEEMKSGYLMLKIAVQIQGHQGYGPGDWTFFDRPTEDKEKIENWDKYMTRFFDAFKIPRGNLNPQTWAGKVGKVHIAKDAKGYMKIMYAVVEQAPAPAAVPVKPAPTKPAPQPSNDGFPDDVPF